MTRQDHARPNSNSLERGTFGWGRWVFTVRASSIEAPDSFQVYANGNEVDIILVVSGITSADPRETWGDGWRSYDAEWKRWFRDQAFMVFYNGTQPETVARPQARGERFCGG